MNHHLCKLRFLTSLPDAASHRPKQPETFRTLKINIIKGGEDDTRLAVSPSLLDLSMFHSSDVVSFFDGDNTT